MTKKHWSNISLPKDLSPEQFLNTLESEFAEGFRVYVLDNIVHVLIRTNLSKETLGEIIKKAENKKS